MKSKSSETNNTYPGKFVPEKDEEKIISQFKKSGYKLIHPFVNVIESVSLYEVQVSAPGLKREELIVFGNNSFLSVDASSNSDLSNKYKNFHQNINMPLTVMRIRNLPLPNTKTVCCIYTFPKPGRLSKMFQQE